MHRAQNFEMNDAHYCREYRHHKCAWAASDDPGSSMDVDFYCREYKHKCARKASDDPGSNDVDFVDDEMQSAMDVDPNPLSLPNMAAGTQKWTRLTLLVFCLNFDINIESIYIVNQGYVMYFNCRITRMHS